MSDEVERRVAGFEVLASLEAVGAATATSLDLPADMPYERYEALGVALGRAHKTVTWMLADWINFGIHAYGEKYDQAESETGLRYETLRNYASVGRRVPRERRRPELPFGVHAEVAPLAPADQERWLEEASRKGWKREQLRDRLRPINDEKRNAGVTGDLEEAARDLVRSARVMGDGYLVARLPFAQLCGALGEEM